MNVLFINTDDSLGGAAQVALTLKNSLDRHGHTTSFFVHRALGANQDVGQLPSSRWRSALASLFATDIDFYNSDKLFNTPEYQHADLIHLHNLHGFYFNLNILPRICREKPVVWTFHDMWPITANCAHSYGDEIENGFYRCRRLSDYPNLLWDNQHYLKFKKTQVYSRSNFNIVTPSQWLEKKVSNSVLGHHPLNLIPNGIDVDTFRPCRQSLCRQKLNLPQGRKIILFLADGGFDNEYKGGQLLPEISHQLSKQNPLFVVIGGSQKKQNGRFRFVPYIHDTSLLSRYYSAADVLLYPSLADSFSLTVAEAMACGLPVVSFATGGIPEIIKHQKNGYLAGYLDSSDLLKGLNFMLNLNHTQLQQVRSQSRSRITNFFSETLMTHRYLKLYKRLIDTFDSSFQSNS